MTNNVQNLAIAGRSAVTPVILSGGAGGRLWPLSRAHHPKQFLALHAEDTLFQETIKRLQKQNLANPLVVCNEEHRFLVAENLRHINSVAESIILEPLARNTAPAIAVAAYVALQKKEDPILLVLPADHIIEDDVAFSKSLMAAEALAEQGMLVTFGVHPTEPHTGYGYIELGDEINEGSYKISAFKEKPDRETAEGFLTAGNYFWNSGMFVFKAARYLEELEKHAPDMLAFAKLSVEKSQKDMDFMRLDKGSFDKCQSDSIDYAVMEKTDKGAVVGLDAKWCDVGSWDSLWNVLPKDKNGNVCHGDVMTQDSCNNYIYAQNKLVATLGVENLIVVETKDAILIADRRQSENMQKIVKRLKEEGRYEIKPQPIKRGRAA